MHTTDDIAVVTGAASGIGAALARRLHQRGARLVLADIDTDPLRALADELGGVVNGLRAFVPRLLADATPSHVLITASLAGLLVWPGGGPYAASKHAVVTVAEQAALAPRGTTVGVTMLCPALVRSGMSPEGDDPLDVADAALAGVDERRFLVMPREWGNALVERGTRLKNGDHPSEPQP